MLSGLRFRFSMIGRTGFKEKMLNTQGRAVKGPAFC